ncbi:DsbA-like protein [Mobiluncus mulieris FB024-16]|uniref:DsbA family protein n=1 Tax=Mobiluncus mulieris TaxID=2052 RepID=UPI0001E51802|nr:thioredoxin domain-containing protein [Mobiluncus mulieris]EFN92476.1 DsbA-like protein [Mobiluncus mulieris FB024-16]NMX18607.1 thioredoxin domain-containing protein [Mobiluncus mulieris]
MAKKKNNSRDEMAPHEMGAANGTDASFTPDVTGTATRSAANVATMRALATLIVLVLLVIAFFLGRASVGNGADHVGAGKTGATSSDAKTGGSKQLAAFVAETGLAPGQDFALPLSEENGRKALKQTQKDLDAPTRTLGKDSAPVTLTVMSDFSCPMCTRWEQQTLPALEELAAAGDVKLQWVNLVIFAEQYRSDIAAHGAIAAGKQGKLWEFVHAAYGAAGEGNHAEYTKESVTEMAKAAGVPDIEKFKTDLTSDETEKQMQDESRSARRLGINGTPFFIVGDSVISGAYPTEYFANTIKYQKYLATH